jgi:hypothetical protein
MAFEWTNEKIAELSLQDLKQLAVNARSRGNEELWNRCEAELLARKPKRSSIGGLPEGVEKVVRTVVARALEKDAVDLLVELAAQLSSKYDLSKETAIVQSAGTDRFIAHVLTDKNGKPKVGRAQKSGRVVFDRYLSYRLKKQIYAILAILVDGDDPNGVMYHVVGPTHILTNARPISEVRHYLTQGETIGLTDFAEEFDNFEAASDRFLFLMEQVAPKR